MDMKTRPDWCPNKSCTTVQTMQDKVCAGMSGGLGRLCVQPGEEAQDICALTELDEGDTYALTKLFEAIDNMRTSHRDRE